jgi:hypothetical protein
MGTTGQRIQGFLPGGVLYGLLEEPCICDSL